VVVSLQITIHNKVVLIREIEEDGDVGGSCSTHRRDEKCIL